MKFKFFNAFFAFVLIFSLSNFLQAEDLDTLRFGYNTWIGDGLFYIAKEKGFFEKEKLQMDMILFEDFATGKQLLTSNKIDGWTITPETVAILADMKVPIQITGMLDVSSGADGIVSKKEIQNVTQLKGKKVAFEVGSPSHFLISYLLNQKGLTTKDLQVADMPAPDAGAAFVAGKIDAAVTWEPWLSKGTSLPNAHLLASSRDELILIDLLAFRTNIVHQKPNAVKKFMRALYGALEWAQKNPDEAIKIIAKNFNTTEQDIRDQYNGFRWVNYKETVEFFKPHPHSAQDIVQNAMDLWLKLGLVKTPLKASDSFDTTLLSTLYQN
jgi:NitT/TauT family transport system substrate-binding protein